MIITLTKKQSLAMKCLRDSTTTEILYGGSAGCFGAETLVTTSSGSKRICDVVIGDLVLSKSSEGSLVYSPVTHTYKYFGDHRCFFVTLRDGTSFFATADHRFFYQGRWVTLESLCLDSKDISASSPYSEIIHSCGDLSASELSPGHIAHFEERVFAGYVYDLTVANTHTYCVTKGRYIAHNSGKSYLACIWLISNCLSYPGSRWLLGRAVLKNLKESTVKTLFFVLNLFMVRQMVTYNSIEGVFKFPNGSEIVLKDLFQYPSDPEFDSLGSTEYTGAVIDEASQITLKAKNIVISRLGRCKNKEFGLLPKLLICSNPCKNWLYSEFYKPWTEGTCADYRCFIPALPNDNNHLDPNYMRNLERLDAVSRERLLYGNWDYDTDPAILCSNTVVADCFTNTFVSSGKKYISADIAMQGRDLFVVSLWDGLRCSIVLQKSKATGKEIEEDIKHVAKKYGVPQSHIVVDSDGMGNYLASYFDNINTFHGGSTANDSRYANLKSECAFKLAELINQGKIYIECDGPTRDEIVAELEQLRRDKIDNDESKIRIIKKESMKTNLGGKSPDFLDVLIMRMYFEVQGSGEAFILPALDVNF